MYTIRDFVPPPLKSVRVWGINGNTFAILIHLSQFAGHFSGGLGVIAPVVLWLVARDQHPDLDRHGRVVINWLISLFIWCLISGALCFVFGIGFPLLGFFAILSVVLPILGAVRAADGKVKPYFTSMTFLKVGP
jgi:uncharacterized Tic20 family protein